MRPLPCALTGPCLCVSVASSLLIRSPAMWIRATPVTLFNPHPLFKGPMSAYGHMPRCWGFGLPIPGLLTPGGDTMTRSHQVLRTYCVRSAGLIPVSVPPHGDLSSSSRHAHSGAHLCPGAARRLRDPAPRFSSRRTYTFSLAVDLNSSRDSDASSRRNGDLHPPQRPRSVGSVQALQVTEGATRHHRPHRLCVGTASQGPFVL